MHSIPPTPVIRVVLAALLAGSITGAAPAQQGGASNLTITVGPPPVPPPLAPETYDRGPSLGPSGRPPSAWDTYPPSYSKRIVAPPPGPFFLPPLLPVLGAGRPAPLAPLAAGYPREAVGEPYLMAYGNLAANNQLGAKRAERIARHRAARLALLEELRGQLQRGPDASVLAGLAASQTPRLLGLETEAEQIRRDLTRVELFATPADDIGRLAPLKDHPNDVLGAVRLTLSAAHFQDGFSPDQRRLLEEMALEAQLVLQPEPEAPGPAPVFFWPAGVRILPPTGLPPAAAAEFAEFQRRKAALKDELRAALDRENARLFNLDETEARARLAAAQAPRFAELEALADQLRPALAASLLSADNASGHRDRQPDYVAAVLTPGLSAPQRRLLLAAAAEESLQ